MRPLVISAFLLLCGFAFADDSNRPVGQNCDLATPPETAGEEYDHGVLLRIYPRARDIGVSYKGCQVIWAQSDKETALAWVVLIDAGGPVRIWSPDAGVSARTAECIYPKGSFKKGDPAKCPDPKDLIMKSLAPGCVASIRDAVAKGGLGAQRPANCEHYE